MKRAAASLIAPSLFACLCAAQAPPERWSLVPELRIGSIDSPNYALSRVGGLAIDHDGSIYVSQPTERHVRVFDASGRYLRTIGREGGGPGEFRSIAAIGLRGDTLWVSDTQQSRLTLFSRTGTPIHLLTIAGAMIDGISTRPTPPGYLTQDGTLLAQPLISGRDDIGSYPLVRMTREGRLIETFGSLRNAPPLRATGTVNGRSVAGVLTPPVTQGGLWSVSPADGSIVIVDRPVATSAADARFTVTRLGSARDTLFHRRYVYSPRELSRAVIDDLLRSPDWASDDFFAEPLRRYLTSLRYDTPITRVVAGLDGTTWIRREEHGVTEVEWVVLDELGEVIAFLHTPPGLRILVAERGRVWGVESTELDVEHVVRYSVRRP